MLPALLLPVLLAAPAPAEGPVRVVALARDGDLTARLHVKRQASLASAGWLVLELDNAGPEPLEVLNVNWWIEAGRDDLKTRKGVCSGRLGSGGGLALLPDAAKAVRPDGPRLLPGGRAVRVVDPVSDATAALLGPAPPNGLLVRATFHLVLTLKGGRPVATPDEGVPFAFEWHPLDAAGVRSAGNRLRGLLASPANTAPHGDLLGALLDVPEVAREASRDDLLAGLAARGKPGDGRDHVARAVNGRFAADPKVVAFYREKLVGGDDAAVHDLAQADVWHPSFTGPLVAYYETHPGGHDALSALARHRAGWDPAAKAPGRLSAVVWKANPILGKPLGTLTAGDQWDWSMAASTLSRTGDPAALATLRPALDDRRPLDEAPRVPRPGALPPSRVCDVAAFCVRTLLDLAPPARDGPGPSGGPGFVGPPNPYYWVDRDVTDIKKQLAAR